MPCMPCSLRVAALAAVLPVVVAFGLGSGEGSPGHGQPVREKSGEVSPEGSRGVLEQRFELMDGSETSLAAFKGKVVLVVNTASKCGLTPQYEALEKLYREHKDAGFVVIGFPANNFAGQEPGSNKEILEFCTGTYDVSFPMASKISVKGEDAHPLYKALAALPEPLGGEPGWNFTKFLIDRDGSVVARFEPRTTPDDPAVKSRIESLLGDG